MTLREQIMKLQTYKMFEGEDTVYVERDDILELLERSYEDWKFYYKHGYTQAKRDLSCDDCISRHAVLDSLKGFEILHNHDELRTNLIDGIMNLPSVTPSYNSIKSELEPCDDCISRAEAIKETKALFLRNFDFEYVVEMLKTLPSVTPKARWTPCSERLPKENEYIGDVCKYYLIQDEYGDMHVARLSNVGWIPMRSLKAIGDEIIAWQELPQPYKAESEEV